MDEVKYKILLVEDDVSLGYVLSEYLKINGFDVNWNKNASEAIKTLKQGTFDLAILDVTLPDMDGFGLSQKIKARFSQLPFIFLTARSMKIDVLKGFSVGAVDYLKKPIDEDELVARIKAILGRVSTSNNIQKVVTIHQIGRYRFNTEQQTLSLNDHVKSLTNRESEVLQYLVSRRNTLCSHRSILTEIWGENDYFNKKSLNVFITHLRKYLADDPSVKIENIHNRGFILKTR